jgi:hypothetical protein
MIRSVIAAIILKVDGRDPQNREKNAPAGRFTCMIPWMSQSPQVLTFVKQFLWFGFNDLNAIINIYINLQTLGVSSSMTGALLSTGALNNSCKGVKQINNRISLNMTFTFTIRFSLRFSSAREFQMGNFQKY